MNNMRSMVVVEEGPRSFGAYVPDFPGCAVVGESAEEVTQLIKEAIELHLADMKARRDSIPLPNSNSASVEVQV
jgi:predicted RNase H-like HicB family nuclease